MATKLSKQIIQKHLGEDYRVERTDHRDWCHKYELPGSGIELDVYAIDEGEPTDYDSLGGFDGFIYINTEEELVAIKNLSYGEICKQLSKRHKNFDNKKYM